jgi:hypothetical protein
MGLMSIMVMLMMMLMLTMTMQNANLANPMNPELLLCSDWQSLTVPK